MSFAFPLLQTRRMSRSPRMGITAVKVCGIVSAADAELVTQVARDELSPTMQLLLGMILWPGSRRSVDHATARMIASKAIDAGATPIAVFVDENTDQISSSCDDIGITIAQLHGKKCREAVQRVPPPSWLSIVDVVDVQHDGFVEEDSLPAYGTPPLWRLYDAKGGGTGRAFDWSQFRPPSEDWFLAGGLTPDNVVDAINALRPTGLDVASGVSEPDGLVKCEMRLREFFRKVMAASASL